MASAINFNHHLTISTVKINDIITNYLLAIKVEPLKLLFLHPVPKNNLRKIASSSQLPCPLPEIWIERQFKVVFTRSFYHPVISRLLMTPLRGRGITLSCSRILFMLLSNFHKVKLIN